MMTPRRQMPENPKYTELIPNLFTKLKKYRPMTKFAAMSTNQTFSKKIKSSRLNISSTGMYPLKDKKRKHKYMATNMSRKLHRTVAFCWCYL